MFSMGASPREHSLEERERREGQEREMREG